MIRSDAENVKPPAEVRCGNCGRRIETCCCEEPGCAHPSCDRCLHLKLGETVAVVHVHGG